MTKLKFLVLGSTGMAGHTISMYLKERGHEVTGYSRNKSMHCRSIVGDAYDTEKIKHLIINGTYDSVVNCIGILNKDAEKHKENAVFLNAYLPHFLADITNEIDTQVIQISTDCVFSGSRGNYTEYDQKDGITFYDQSKALGELDDNKNITLRTSIIGPDISKEGIGLLNWFMQQKGTITGYRKVLWSGVTTLELAKIIEVASEQKATGLFNMVYMNAISKYELLVLLNKYIRGEVLTINPSDNPVVDKSLLRTRYSFNYIVPKYETMIVDIAEWINNHSIMYPHYNYIN